MKQPKNERRTYARIALFATLAVGFLARGGERLGCRQRRAVTLQYSTSSTRKTHQSHVCRGASKMPILIRIVWAMLIAFAAAAVCTATEMSAGGAMTFFDFTFPEEIAGAQRISIHDYESSDPGMGYSAGYRQGTLTGTVYIYGARNQPLPDNPHSPLVKAELEKSRADIVRLWLQAGARVDEKESFTIEDARGRTRLICAAFSITGNRVADTFSCVGVTKNKFLKFRISTRQHDTSQSEARRFVDAWVNLLWPPA
jgi:hypothetical protein